MERKNKMLDERGFTSKVEGQKNQCEQWEQGKEQLREGGFKELIPIPIFGKKDFIARTRKQIQ